MASPYAAPAAFATPVPAAAAAPTSVASEQLVAALSASLARLSELSSRVPGSAIVWRYLKASHQDDPFRTVLEVLLVFFIVRTYLMARTKGESSGKNFVKLSEKVRVPPCLPRPFLRLRRRAQSRVGTGGCASLP